MSRFNTGIFLLKKEGLKGFIKILYEKTFHPKIDNYKEYQRLFSNKIGFEIGGPSNIFARTGKIPIYPCIKNLDGCNFSNNTIWEGKIRQGKHYKYDDNKGGYQYICDGTSLSQISNESYDFVLACNCLEHIANPLKAIKEWLRIIKLNGTLLLILPNKRSNFDHNRPTTLFTHIISDYENNIQEDDLTHLDEILRLHDLSLDPPAGDFEQFKARSIKNYENRAIHHHVYDIKLLKNIFNKLNVKILFIDDIQSDYIIVGQKIT